MRAEVAKQKICYMESEDSLRKKNALLNEWEKVHANIRLLCQDLLLNKSVLDSDSREDIKQDIASSHEHWLQWLLSHHTCGRRPEVRVPGCPSSVFCEFPGTVEWHTGYAHHTCGRVAWGLNPN
jgi:hypothetical protein